MSKKNRESEGNVVTTEQGDAVYVPKDVPEGNGTRKPRKRTADPNETKADKFRRLANYRVNVAIETVRRVGNLASKSQYEYSDDQAEAAVEALTAAVKRVAEKFSGKREESYRFQL